MIKEKEQNDWNEWLTRIYVQGTILNRISNIDNAYVKQFPPKILLQNLISRKLWLLHNIN